MEILFFLQFVPVQFSHLSPTLATAITLSRAPAEEKKILQFVPFVKRSLPFEELASCRSSLLQRNDILFENVCSNFFLPDRSLSWKKKVKVPTK